MIATIWRRLLPLAGLSVVLLLSGCSFMSAELVNQQSDFAGLEMEADIGGGNIEITVHNYGENPATIIWADSSYVYASGEADRLVPIETGDVDWSGQPRDETIPANAAITTYVAPMNSVDPQTGRVSIPIGPAGSEVRVVLAVRSEGRDGVMDYRYRFEEEE